MTRTLLRIHIAGEVKTVDALASCRVAGYTFLIHRADHNKDQFCATYAPLGLSSSGSHTTIQSAIDALVQREDVWPNAIKRSLAVFQADYWPALAPEEGISVTADWRWREQSRFESGEYQAVPDVAGLTYPEEHFLHLSVTKQESDFVAYTPSAEYGERDRQVRMRFGKYLRKAFPSLSDADVQTAVIALRTQLALADSPACLMFATDRATINQIFETKMCACDSTTTSCMYGKFAGDAIRPYHVYADSPDVAVAYLLEHGEIVARSVVSTKGLRWVRAYAVGGCSTKCGVLTDLLGQAGYRRGELTGNRLTKLKTYSVMLPYIDNGGANVLDCGGYWEVTDADGDYTADQTDGTASPCAPRCSGCDQPEDECECYYCECCEERSPDGCDRCSMCPACDRCIEHEACQCERCSECGHLLDPPRGYRAEGCDCDRCTECNELESECECEEEIEDDETTDTEESARDAAIPAASTI